MVDEQLDNWKEELAGMDSLLVRPELVLVVSLIAIPPFEVTSRACSRCRNS